MFLQKGAGAFGKEHRKGTAEGKPKIDKNVYCLFGENIYSAVIFSRHSTF